MCRCGTGQGCGLPDFMEIVRLHSFVEVALGPMSLASSSPRGQNSFPPSLGLEGCLSSDDVLSCIPEISLDQWAVLSLVFGPALVPHGDRSNLELCWLLAVSCLLPPA